MWPRGPRPQAGTVAPSPRSDPPAPAHAVVVGAGVAGLAAAAALRRHVERVTIVERDVLPSLPAVRSGVPAGRHAHGLLPGGLPALDRLVPGLRDDLVAHGAVTLTAPRDVLWLSAAGWMTPVAGRGRTLVAASRELIEHVTRRRVLADPAVRVRTGVEVAGLAVDAGTIVGVDLRPRGAAPGEPTERLGADLMVDASGRRSRAPEWLAAAGYERPVETVVDAGVATASRMYRRAPRDTVAGHRAVWIQARAPHTRRTGVMLPVEDDRWLLTLAGADGDMPPTDEDGFLAFARGLRSPVLAAALSRLEPVSPITGHRKHADRLRHYEDLRGPANFVVVGGATCALGPVHGHAMSAGALSAEALDRALARYRARRGTLAGGGASHAAQRAVARATQGAWRLAAGEDLRYPRARGRAPASAGRLARRYLDRVLAAATVDQAVNAALYDVLALVAEPSSLVRPALACRVLGRRPAAPPADPPLPYRAPDRAGATRR
jgi:2-polyprenyl-6-methoxyphenol hydroxylase-like FAD-dependent oxidoreductase